MKVLSITAMAMIHGLMTGCGSLASFAISLGICKYGRLDGEAGPQQVRGVLSRLEDDLDRHALHHLDVISGGVFRRQDAELLARSGGERIHVAAELPPAKLVHGNLRPLAGPNVLELIFLEVRD